MTFRETLEEHLRAIKQRDLPALAATLPDDELTLIMADGRVVRSVDEVVAFHRDWFSSASWSLETRLEELTESDALGLAVIYQMYRDDRPDVGPTLERSYRSLAFARQGDRWVMIHHQKTEVRPPSDR